MVHVDFAARARALVGARFRPQGRGVGGYDCVGLALDVYRTPAEAVRSDYLLRGDHEQELRAYLSRYFRRVGRSEARSGDLLLLKIADDQLHLAVRTPTGFVHAHAALRRVVETPGTPAWNVIGNYRKRSR